MACGAKAVILSLPRVRESRSPVVKQQSASWRNPEQESTAFANRRRCVKKRSPLGRRLFICMKKYIALIATIVILSGGAFFTQQWFIGSSNSESSSQTSGSIIFTATATSTVLETMYALAAEDTLSFSGHDFPGLGFFVEEINGRKNADGYYWILLINGEKSGLGASSAEVWPGDVVEWRYEEGY